MENNKTKKEEKIKKKSNYKRYLVIGLNVALLLANFLILSLIPGQVEMMIVARSEILAQEIQNQSAQKILSDVKAAEQDKKIIESTLPDKSRLLEIIEFIESLNNYTRVQSFKFESEEPAKDEKGLIYLPVTLILEGYLPESMAAMNKLQQSPYMFKPIQTLIESPEGLAGRVVIRTTLRLYVREPFN